MDYLVVTEPWAFLALSVVVSELGGRLFHSFWVVRSDETPDALAIKLRRASRAHVVVCRMDTCSYQ
jgi:hypothetical protein